MIKNSKTKLISAPPDLTRPLGTLSQRRGKAEECLWGDREGLLFFKHMRKIIYIAVLITLFVNSSCINDDFANSAAARIQTELGNSKQVLCSAENGWLMQYYATPESRGYSLLIKFEPSESVTIAGRNKMTDYMYLESESLYTLAADYGAVLSFNTYNDVLHVFSDPAYPPLGSGLMGDYEFIIRHQSETSFEMVGKKRGTRILMEKLPTDVLWEEYLDQLNKMENTLFGQKPPVLNLLLGNDLYTFSGGASGEFNILGPDILEGWLLYMPFIVTKSGIKLYEPLELGGYTFQDFNLNEERSALISKENADIKLTGVSNLTEYYHKEASLSTNTWYIDRANSSPDIQALCDRIEESLKTRYGSNVSDIYLSINRVSDSRIGLVLKFILRATQATSAGYYCDWTRLSDTEASLVYNGSHDNNGQSLYTWVDGIPEFTDLLAEQRSYVLSTATPLNPAKIKFTQKDNPSTVIMLSLEKPE